MLVQEEKETGEIGWQDFVNFLSFSAGNWGFFYYFTLCFSAAGCQLYTTYWVSYWTEQEFEEQQRSLYPTVFGVLIVVYVFLTFFRSLCIFLLFVIGTTNLHKKMVTTIIRSRILFFDSNPIGRIFTRFSKDVSVLDLILPSMSTLATFTVFRTITVFLTIVIVFKEMLAVVFVATIIMAWVMKKGIPPQRECLRLDSIYRGPIHS